MSDERTGSAPDGDLVRSLCAEARDLAKGLRGPVSRLRLQAGDHAIEIEWEVGAASAGGAEGRSVAISSVADAEAPAEDATAGDGHAVTAPLLGTFYRAPQPGAKPFVEEGDVVEAGQDVAIVEAMKIMNRVQADRAGRVVKILAVDGDMVEYGQELMILEPYGDGG
jgi:acetyl-CoA carboxylase biotin carboxyl carrier protein